MGKAELLRERIDALGRVLARTPHAQALLALGSIGIELQRLDEYSDLDFFVIVDAGAKPDFMASLDWLAAAHPIVYQFQNTVDGYKALFDDDIFCEFAIFEPDELAAIPYAPGRIVWKRPDVDARISQPTRAPERAPTPDWMINEALTNLYVGMSRHMRGEQLSASRLIQQHAVDRLLQLSGQIAEAQGQDADIFAPERRYERRFPQLAAYLPSFIQGYAHNAESALAILQFLEQHAQINAQLAQRIRELCRAAGAG